jgi:photosystem II stability/assembly factor-like uncharacterized protein
MKINQSYNGSLISIIALVLLIVIVPFKVFCQQTTWSKSTTPGLVESISRFLKGRNNYLFALLGTGDIIRSSDDGVTWTAVSTGYIYNGLTCVPNGDLVAGREVVWRSTDNGETWINGGGPGMMDFAILNNGWIVGVSNSEFWRSQDSAKTWTKISTIAGSYLLYFFYDRKNDVLYHRAEFHCGRGWFWYSSDHGSTWNLSYDFGCSDFNVRQLCVDSSGVLFRMDSPGCVSLGFSTAPITCGLPYLRTMMADPLGRLLIGSDGGIIVSTDHGYQWQSQNKGMLDTVVTSIFLTPTGHLLVGTIIGSIYRSISPITTVEYNASIPTAISLAQNYPNPFNPSTIISFSIVTSSRVVVRIYDLNGREVAEPVNKVMGAGNHQITFHASGLPSGTYFYRLQVDGEFRSRAMLLIK